MTTAWKTLVITILATGAVVLPSVASPAPQLLWNASASVPIGLYRVQPEPLPRLSDIVVVRPPETLVGFLADGGYLPRGVPLLKHVAALGGQRVCRIGAAISIDGVTVGEALGHDRRGRPLPVWQGCTVPAEGAGSVRPVRDDRQRARVRTRALEACTGRAHRSACLRRRAARRLRGVELQPEARTGHRLEAVMDLGCGVIHSAMDEHLPQAVSV